MSTTEEVASNFIPVFFERLASNPAELACMYGEHSSLMVVDFEYGTTEAVGAEVMGTLERWAQILQGCEITVESYSAVPFYSGVSVYVTMSAETKTVRHYFQLVTLLEAYSTVAYGPTGYYIRHQIVIRPGAVEKEQPVMELAPLPDPKLEAISVPEPAAEGVAKGKQQSKKSQRQEQEQEQQEKKVPTEVKTTKERPSSTAAAAERTTSSADQQPSSKPKTWASLASSMPKGEQRQPVKVTSHENGVNAEMGDAAVAALKTAQQDQQAASPKTHVKASRPPLPPIGDRLMFNIDYVVSDDEIKLALGPLAAHVVSLRNNSANGHVFLDFSDKEKVLDVLKANPPMVGSRQTRVNIYRQRARQ